jgi:hypothetical protein
MSTIICVTFPPPPALQMSLSFLQGMDRNCGVTELIAAQDGSGFTDGAATGAVQVIQARRETRPANRTSSYQYKLELTTKEVLKLLFELDRGGIPEAVANLADDWELKELIPELLQRLAEGLAKGVEREAEVSKESVQAKVSGTGSLTPRPVPAI